MNQTTQRTYGGKKVQLGTNTSMAKIAPDQAPKKERVPNLGENFVRRL